MHSTLCRQDGAARDGKFGGGAAHVLVLDVVRLIEDHELEGALFQRLHKIAHQRVRHYDKVVLPSLRISPTYSSTHP